jgi:uncharacterized protein (DUF2249 family)
MNSQLTADIEVRQAQAERQYRRVIEEFDRLKALRAELPNEPSPIFEHLPLQIPGALDVQRLRAPPDSEVSDLPMLN